VRTPLEIRPEEKKSGSVLERRLVPRSYSEKDPKEDSEGGSRVEIRK